MSLFSKFASFFVDLYRVFISPFKVPCCRFQPTCSQYAKQALEKHSFFKAILLILKRILRCHQWGGRGYDPVPMPTVKKKEKK